ncbi:MAG: DNA methyltransferase, partial [Acidimicrobiales bacterium]
MDLVEFYRHEANWSNRMILGDSLQVMASLDSRERLRGKVQMIYLDPPYGIKFGSNWQVSARKRDVKDGKVEDIAREVEQIKAFRDTWELGINSYLSYLRDRLLVARDLLTESGSIFVQIGDENVHLVRSLLDEVFGSENFVSLITLKKTTGAGSPSGTTDVLAGVTDYILWYAKLADAIKYRRVYRSKEAGGAGATQYNLVERRDGRREALSSGTAQLGDRVFSHDQLTSQSPGQTTIYDFQLGGRAFKPGQGGWKTTMEGMRRLESA